MKIRQNIRRGVILVSFFFFPATFYYLSPVLIIQASSEGIINGSFMFFSLLFMSSLVVGRAFCGWVCPGAGCQEAIFSVRNKRIHKGDFIKWIIWIPWIMSIILLSFKSGGFQKVDFFYKTTYGLSIGDVSGLIAYLLVLIVLIVFPAFTIGKRAFCHQICWMAPFMIVGRKIRNYFQWPSLRLLSRPEQCEHCHTCTQNCPMSLPVEKMVKEGAMENSECILCGTCVDGCESNAIRFAFKS